MTTSACVFFGGAMLPQLMNHNIEETMAFRFEDRGLTLRLFVSKRDALAYPNVREPMRYATGWIAKNRDGRWIDGNGVLPPNWQPHHAFLVPNNH